ncbi:ORF2 [Beet western yellows virus associated RNA]|uniref:ORF2 n=1 Tax=Beet western yellows virus associated RNA TaxID=1425367 RepID=A0A0A0P3R2_9VIRU|nr:ORF2 [Beet western yellows virus associated RNA]
MSPDEFLACYAGRKKTIYAKAILSLAATPLNIRDFRVRAFIKKEKDKLLSSNSDPRIIQPRHPRFLVSLGRYIRPLEQIVYKSLRDCSSDSQSQIPPCASKASITSGGGIL